MFLWFAFGSLIFTFPRQPFSAGKVQKVGLVRGPSRSGLTVARPIRWDDPAHRVLGQPVMFVESADVNDGLFRGTPLGYKTTDNKV